MLWNPLTHIKWMLHSLICTANQLNGFYMNVTLARYGLKGLHNIIWGFVKGISEIIYFPRKIIYQEILQKCSVFRCEITSRYLLVESQQWKHQNNVWNPFKFNSKENRTTFNKDTRTTLMASFWCLFWKWFWFLCC